METIRGDLAFLKMQSFSNQTSLFLNLTFAHHFVVASLGIFFKIHDWMNLHQICYPYIFKMLIIVKNLDGKQSGILSNLKKNKLSEIEFVMCYSYEMFLQHTYCTSVAALWPWKKVNEEPMVVVWPKAKCRSRSSLYFWQKCNGNNQFFHLCCSSC